MPTCFNPATLGAQDCDQLGPPGIDVRPPLALVPGFPGGEAPPSGIGAPGAPMLVGGSGGAPRPRPIRPLPKGRPPPPIAAPGASPSPASLPEVTVSALLPGSVPFGPIGAAVAPFAFALPEPAPPKPFYYRDDLLEEALARTGPRGNPPPSYMEEAIATTEQTRTFEQAILATEESALARAGGARVLTGIEDFIGGVLGIGSRALGPLGLLMTSQDLGPSAAEESAIVAAALSTLLYPTPTVVVDPRLSPDTLVAVPEPGLSPVVVTASRPAALPLVDSPLGQPGVATGVLGLPVIAGQAQPEPRRAPQTLPEPAPLPSPSPVGLAEPRSLVAPTTQPQPRTEPRTQTQPGPSPLANVAPGLATMPGLQPQTATQTDPCKQSKQKKSKKKKQREVCHRGTYIEHKSGLTKHPKETIECQ